MIFEEKIKDISAHAVASICNLQAGNHKMTGTPSGLDQLDKKIDGFQPGGIYLVAARPGVGKTSFAVNALVHSALKLKKTSMFYSAFNNESEVMERILSQLTKISLYDISSGKLNGEQCNLIEEAANQISKSRMHIECIRNLNAENIFQQAIAFRKLHKELSILVIDGVNSFIDVDAGPEFIKFFSKAKKPNRNRKIEAFLMQLSFWAQKLACPVVITWQLGPDIDQKKNKRPCLSDLHLSAVMEDIVDAVLIIHREDIYKYEWQRNNVADIFIARNRLGKTGFLHVDYSTEILQFTNPNA